LGGIGSGVVETGPKGEKQKKTLLKAPRWGGVVNFLVHQRMKGARSSCPGSCKKKKRKAEKGTEKPWDGGTAGRGDPVGKDPLTIIWGFRQAQFSTLKGGVLGRCVTRPLGRGQQKEGSTGLVRNRFHERPTQRADGRCAITWGTKRKPSKERLQGTDQGTEGRGRKGKLGATEPCCRDGATWEKEGDKGKKRKGLTPI